MNHFEDYENKLRTLLANSKQHQTQMINRLMNQVFITQQRGSMDDLSYLHQIQLEEAPYDDLASIYYVCMQCGDDDFYQEVISRLSGGPIIYNYLQDHTQIRPDTPKTNYMRNNHFLYAPHIKAFKFREQRIQISTTLGPISYYQASDRYLQDNFALKNAVLNERIKDGNYRCHELSLDFIRTYPSKAVTGLISNTGGCYFHSWVEQRNFCIDIAHNLVLKRDDFYRLCQPVVWHTLSTEEADKMQLEPYIEISVAGKTYHYFSLYALALLRHYSHKDLAEVTKHKVK